MSECNNQTIAKQKAVKPRRRKDIIFYCFKNGFKIELSVAINLYSFIITFQTNSHHLFL